MASVPRGRQTSREVQVGGRLNLAPGLQPGALVLSISGSLQAVERLMRSSRGRWRARRTMPGPRLLLTFRSVTSSAMIRSGEPLLAATNARHSSRCGWASAHGAGRSVELKGKDKLVG